MSRFACVSKRGTDWRMDLFTTHTHDSGLQVITALSLISTLQIISTRQVFSVFTSRILVTDFNTVIITVSL
jgi:hypothetical protein